MPMLQVCFSIWKEDREIEEESIGVEVCHKCFRNDVWINPENLANLSSWRDPFVLVVVISLLQRTLMIP